MGSAKTNGDADAKGAAGPAVLSEWAAPAVLRVTLARGRQRNTLTFEMLAGLDAALDLATSAGARAVILTGQDRAFCGGAEISYFTEPQAGLADDPAAIRDRYVREIIRIFRRLQAAPFLTLAAVNGYALGGGCELAIACDMRIASEEARFALPEVRLGAVPAAAGLQQLARIIGRARALEMVLLGEPADASTAAAIGLVRSVHSAAELPLASLSLAMRLLAASPAALAAAKQAIYASESEPAEGCDRIALAALDEMTNGDDWAEGMRAFREKRAAGFVLAAPP